MRKIDPFLLFPFLMPVFNLLFKAELENVESVAPDEDTIWRLKVVCSKCRCESSRFIEVCSKDEVSVPDSRGTSNCIYTCKEFVLFW